MFWAPRPTPAPAPQELSELSRGVGDRPEAQSRVRSREMKVALNGLIRAGMLRDGGGERRSFGAAPKLQFAHGSIADAAYSLLPDELKAQLHASAAAFYEAQFERQRAAAAQPTRALLRQTARIANLAERAQYRTAVIQAGALSPLLEQLKSPSAAVRYHGALGLMAIQ